MSEARPWLGVNESIRLVAMKVLLIALILLATVLCACHGGRSQLKAVQDFRAARKAGDLETARSYLTDDPRVWYDAHEALANRWRATVDLPSTE